MYALFQEGSQVKNIKSCEKHYNTIDHYVRKCGESRSGLLAQAITEYMAAHQIKGQGGHLQ